VTTTVCPIFAQQKTNDVKLKCCYNYNWLVMTTCTKLVIQLEEFVVPHPSITVRPMQREKSCMETSKLFIHNCSVCVGVRVRACVRVCVRASAHALVCWTFRFFGMIHHHPFPCLPSFYQTKLTNERRKRMWLGRLLSPKNCLPTYIANV
jgi:hypothetical protein